jgi:hypothetical protein
MKKKSISIIIPGSVKFSDLDLSRDPITGEIAFSWEPIEIICQHSGIDSDLFRHQTEDNVAELITRWYAAHIDGGGARDPIADQLIDEVLFEDLLGHPALKTSGPQ